MNLLWMIVVVLISTIIGLTLDVKYDIGGRYLYWFLGFITGIIVGVLA